MSHSEGTHSVQRALPPRFEWNGLTFPDLLEPDQWHFREYFGVLNLFAKFFISAEHTHHDARLRGGLLEFISAPLQDCIANGFDTLATPEEVDCARAQPGKDIERHNMTSIPCLMEDRHLEKWAL